MCVQEAAYRSKAEDRDMARNAVGVLGGRDDSERRRRQQYAADLEDQMRAKQVRLWLNAVQAIRRSITQYRDLCSQQEAEYRSKAEDRDLARNAVGVLGGRDDSERRRRQQYAADLEDQMRAKQVRGDKPVPVGFDAAVTLLGNARACGTCCESRKRSIVRVHSRVTRLATRWVCWEVPPTLRSGDDSSMRRTWKTR